MCLRRGDATRVVTRDTIRDRAGVWDDMIDQALVYSPPGGWEFFEDGTGHSMVSRRAVGPHQTPRKTCANDR